MKRLVHVMALGLVVVLALPASLAEHATNKPKQGASQNNTRPKLNPRTSPPPPAPPLG